MARKSRKYPQIETPIFKYEKQFSAAIYVRLSNEERFDKANKNSFKNQKAFILDYVEQHPEISIYKIYEDNGNTGTNFDRPAFSEMMYDVSNEKVDCIIVKDLSRFGREYIEMGQYLEYLFPMIGLRFIAINDNYDTYDKIKNSDIVVPFKNVINSVYSKDISKKVRSSMLLKQHKGDFVGTYATYGYMLDKSRRFIIDKFAASIVKRIFDMYDEGMTILKIAKTLTAEGVDTPSVYKFKNNIIKSEKIVGSNVWNFTTVKNILENEVYLGHMVQGKKHSLFYEKGESKMVRTDKNTWIKVEYTHDPIIDKELFLRVKNRLAKNALKERKANTSHLFSSKLYCAECGKGLHYRKSKNAIYYICQQRYLSPTGCNFKSVQHIPLCDIIFKSIKTYILNVCDFNKAVNKNIEMDMQVKNKNMYEVKIRNIQREIDETKKQRFNLFNDYIDKTINADEFAFARKKYCEKINSLEIILSELNKKVEMYKKSSQQSEWLNNIKKYKSARKLTREMLECFIERIEVSSDRTIHIKWRFNNDSLMNEEGNCEKRII